ncbi:hypothetical protein [Effusibacillus dendaii]|nr:hypothetical protein [Effusibacillus dendaii]
MKDETLKQALAIFAKRMKEDGQTVAFIETNDDDPKLIEFHYSTEKPIAQVNIEEESA